MGETNVHDTEISCLVDEPYSGFSLDFLHMRPLFFVAGKLRLYFTKEYSFRSDFLEMAGFDFHGVHFVDLLERDTLVRFR